MSKVATNLLGAGIIALIALGVGFLATHHQENYNCKQTIEGRMCDFRYVGN